MPEYSVTVTQSETSQRITITYSVPALCAHTSTVTLQKVATGRLTFTVDLCPHLARGGWQAILPDFLAQTVASVPG